MPEYRTGDHGSTVAVVTRPGRRNWYLRVWDPSSKAPRYISTRTPDFAAAKVQARTLARQLEDDAERVHSTGPSLRAILRRYLEDVTPRKGDTTRRADQRRAAMWLAFLDGSMPAARVTRYDWERFAEARASGKIDGRGQAAARRRSLVGHHGQEPKPMGRRGLGAGGFDSLAGFTSPSTVLPRTVRADLSWLRSVLTWAAKRELIPTNPTEKYDLPADGQPRRPLASRERYEATMEQAGGMLAEILPVVVLSGRRLSSVLHLQYGDLRLDAKPPTMRWRAATDKLRREATLPVGHLLHGHLEAVVHSRPGCGAAWLFPSPKDPGKPVDRWCASRWLRRAEKDANLEPLDGSLWHAYRRMWATERKHLSRVDVAYYGGWTNVLTLELIYQRPDDRSLLEVAEGNYELREKRRELREGEA